jgi:hypothetical protein
MTIDSMLDLLEQHAFASMMGQPSVLTFRDPQHGMVSFAFMGGLTLPYNGYLAIITGYLFDTDAWIGVDWTSPNHLSFAVSLWAKMKLPPKVFRELSDGKAPGYLLTKIAQRMLEDRCAAEAEEDRIRQVGEFLDLIETAYMDSLAAPVDAENVVALFAPVEVPWKAADADESN